MRILGLFFNNEIRTGGHKRYLELMEGLAKSGADVTVLMNSALDWRPSSFRDPRLDIPYRKGSRPFNGRKFLRAAREALASMPGIDRDSFDALLIFGESHWPAARLVSRKTGIPACLAFRSDLVTENLMFLRYEEPSLSARAFALALILRTWLMEANIFRRAKTLFFQSESDMARFIARHGGASREAKRGGRAECRVIRGDIRLPRFRAEFALSNRSTECRKLLFVGTLGARKGLKYVLEAMANLRRAGDDTLSLDILAAGSDWAPLEAFIRANGLEGAVRFHGAVADPFPWYRDSDLLVVPSLFDSYPNTILEALHAGLPVIASDTGGIPDMLGDRELLFSPASSGEIEEKLRELVSDSGRYRRMKEYCATRRSYFDFDWPAEWLKAME